MDIPYSKLFETSPLARLLVQAVLNSDQDYDFEIVHANKAAFDYFDEDGASPLSLATLVDENNASHMMKALKVSLQSGMPVNVQLVPKKVSHLRIQSFVANPVKLDDGGFLIDLQARPLSGSTESLKKERDDAISLMTSVFDASALGIVVIDHHARIVRLNDAFLDEYGWSAVDLIGKEFTVLIPQSEHDLARERHKEHMDSSERYTLELRIKRKDGMLAYVIATSVLMEMGEGRKFRIFTITDVTYLRELERNLRAAKDAADASNKAKSAFLANMSHELRTPLNAIIGFSEMMMSEVLGPIENEQYKDYLFDIKFSAMHLLAIINDVLDMSKIEAGKMTLDDEAIEIEGLLESVKRLMTAKANERDLTINTHFDGPHHIVSLDERMIRQVFINLLSNAVKFSNEGGEIDLEVSVNNGRVSVKFIDHGVGIGEDHLQDVLEPFGQVSDPRLNNGQGTGLGLPLAKAMMELHDGKLDIETKINEGTTVICTFPAYRHTKV